MKSIRKSVKRSMRALHEQIRHGSDFAYVHYLTTRLKASRYTNQLGDPASICQPSTVKGRRLVADP